MTQTLTHTSTAREQAIVDLLRTMRDLEGASVSGTSSGSRDCDRLLYADGGEWDKSGCDKLDELLRVLRAERPVQWWHLTERYLRCDVRPRRVRVYRGASGRERLPKLGPYCEPLGHGVRPPDLLAGGEVLIVVETWPAEVRPEKVRRAVRFLAERFPWNDYRWRDLRQEAAA